MRHNDKHSVGKLLEKFALHTKKQVRSQSLAFEVVVIFYGFESVNSLFVKLVYVYQFIGLIISVIRLKQLLIYSRASNSVDWKA